MKKCVSFCLLLLMGGFVLGSLLTPDLSWAQEEANLEPAESPELDAVNEPSVELRDDQYIFEGQRYAIDIEKLKRSYRGELETYRNSEHRYQIAKDQYKTLETLTALEDAVRATQDVMKARGQVLKTYLQILKLSLLDTPGINLDQKQPALEKMVSVQERLDAHILLLDPTLDKPELLEVTADFSLLKRDVDDIAHEALTLLAIGKLQNVYDKSVTLNEQMKVDVATGGGALKEAERKRAFDETDRTLQKTRTDLDKAVELSKHDRNQQSYRNQYRRVTDQLGLVYADLSQVLSFLQELLRI